MRGYTDRRQDLLPSPWWWPSRPVGPSTRSSSPSPGGKIQRKLLVFVLHCSDCSDCLCSQLSNWIQLPLSKSAMARYNSPRLQSSHGTEDLTWLASKAGPVKISGSVSPSIPWCWLVVVVVTVYTVQLHCTLYTAALLYTALTVHIQRSDIDI